ncbi:hypothetical protein D3C74_475120 [compost metagenome]
MKRVFRNDTYNLDIHQALNHNGNVQITLDGVPIRGNTFPYFGDGKVHQIQVNIR